MTPPKTWTLLIHWASGKVEKKHFTSYKEAQLALLPYRHLDTAEAEVVEGRQ